MKKDDIVIVPATPELLARFYGHAPVRTVRAVVAMKDDKPLAIGGVYLSDGHCAVFAELNDEFRRDKRALIRGLRAVLGLVRDMRLPVYSYAEETIPGSTTLLEHMGFVQQYGRVYQWQS